MISKLELLKQQYSISSTGVATITLFIAIIPISFAPILVRLCEQEISANAVAFHRGWMGTVVFGLWRGMVLIHRRSSDPQTLNSQPLTKRDLGLMLCMGVTSAISLSLWVWSVTETSVANVTLLFGLNPLFVGLAGWLFLSQQFNRQFLIGMVLALIGFLAIELNDLQFTTHQIWGDTAALFAGIFFAAYLILAKQLRNRFTATTIMLWQCGFTTLFFLPFLPFDDHRLLPYSVSGWFFLIFQGLFCQVFGQVLLTYSLGQLSSSFVAVTTLLEPVLASIIAWFVFSETLNFSDWIAFAIILLGIYIATSSSSTEMLPEQFS
jgi:drug/metabolite transporter (DMT)-like permease